MEGKLLDAISLILLFVVVAFGLALVSIGVLFTVELWRLIV